jgi:DivIVA domain-containing protein
MTGGDSRSLFVVQRAFRRVRRGYDPEEVDRHLQLVSEWFASGRGGRTAREAEQQLMARERAAVEAEEATRKELEGERVEAEATLEGARVEAEATLEGARLRAKGDIEAAGREAARIVTEARAEAQRILDGARTEADHVLAELRADAEARAAARREELDNELRSYEDRRRREADRLVEAARRERFGPDAYSP